MKRFGVDTGGTFTDVVAVTAAGELQLHKLLSTPDDPGRALRTGVSHVSASAADELVHGTTVATNALLERRGARIGLVTTRGFESVLRLGRQARPELYALEVTADPPLVAPEDVFGLVERTSYDGEVIVALDDAELGRLSAWAKGAGLDAVAVCLLHSYANDGHERAVAVALQQAVPDLHISTSSEILPEFREFERASTTSVNAYVGPVMASYLGRIEEELEMSRIDIFLSSGGRASLSEAADKPVHTVLSGPAGGVVGALAAAGEVGIGRVISFDMGGTSTDVSLAVDTPSMTRSGTIGSIPVGVPVLDIETVGAGGGSIAWRDRGGALRVGPRSAGASPGPACYGQGGEEPTVTDAHLYLGRLRPDAFLGGRMTLDFEAAERAIVTLAAELGMSAREVALGILEVADAAMVRALKVVSLERGHDPSDFTLVSFGGAGGLHATRLADALEISRVLVPNHPGLLSAWGMLHAPRQWTSTVSVMASITEVERLEKALERLEAEASARLSGATTHLTAALRYAGQSFELEVPVRRGMGAEALREAFEERHERLYGYRAERDVECVAVHVDARTEPPSLPVSSAEGAVRSGGAASVVMNGFDCEASIVERAALDEGEVLRGPAVVTEMSGTTVVPPGWVATVQAGHLLLEREDA